MDRPRRGEKGAVAVEFALLAPLIVIILFAIIEFGIALTYTLSYVSGAREGARYAAIQCRPESLATAQKRCTNTLIADRIEASLPAGYPVAFKASPDTSLSVSLDCSVSGNAGKLVTVTWTESVPVDVPFLPDLGWTIHPTGTFRCE